MRNCVPVVSTNGRTQPNGSLQASIGQIVILAYLFFTTWLQPFARFQDNALQVASLIGELGGKAPQQDELQH